MDTRIHLLTRSMAYILMQNIHYVGINVEGLPAGVCRFDWLIWGWVGGALNAMDTQMHLLIRSMAYILMQNIHSVGINVEGLPAGL